MLKEEQTRDLRKLKNPQIVYHSPQIYIMYHTKDLYPTFFPHTNNWEDSKFCLASYVTLPKNEFGINYCIHNFTITLALHVFETLIS